MINSPLGFRHVELMHSAKFCLIFFVAFLYRFTYQQEVVASSRILLVKVASASQNLLYVSIPVPFSSDCFGSFALSRWSHTNFSLWPSQECLDYSQWSMWVLSGFCYRSFDFYFFGWKGAWVVIAFPLWLSIRLPFGHRNRIKEAIHRKFLPIEQERNYPENFL